MPQKFTTCFSWYCVMLPSIIAPEMPIRTISSIFSDISMHQKCQTGGIHDLTGYFLSKDQIFTCTRFSWPFDLCSPYLNTNLQIIIWMNRVLKYEGYFVVLGLILPEIQWFSFPIPLILVRKERRWARIMTSFSQLAYCRVTKSLPKLFGCAT